MLGSRESATHTERKNKESVASCNNTGSSKTQGARARVKYKRSHMQVRDKMSRKLEILKDKNRQD